MGFIFEAEIITIMNTVRARTIGEADAIRLKEVLAAEIHPAIKAYFKAEVEKLLQQERMKEARSKKFSYGLPEVSGLQHQIDLLLVHQYEFGREEFESLLDEAVHFEFNFLCRPQWTLQEFMFENRRTVGVSEATRKFRYCVEYTYFSEIFTRYVIDRGLAEMNYEEFKALIAKIDREIVNRHSTRELVRLLRPMLEFIEVGMPETIATETGPVLPINAALVFFEDKGVDDVRKELETERDSEGRQVISLSDLEIVIARARKEEVPVPIQHKPKTKEKKSHIRPAPPHAPPSAVQDPVAVEEPVVVQKSVEHEPELEEVYSLFAVKDQKLFVKKLFKKDEVEFRNALDRLNPIRTWKEASFVVDQIFTEQDVDPFSKEAILMTEKLFSRYESAQEKL
jgi:hypothetical protein